MRYSLVRWIMAILLAEIDLFGNAFRLLKSQIKIQNSKIPMRLPDYILRPNLYFTVPHFAPMMQQPRKENYGPD